jgi:hypothetical protein
MIKLRKIKWGHVASVGLMRNTYKVLVGKPKRKRETSGRPRCRGRKMLKRVLNKYDVRMWTRFNWPLTETRSSII